MRIGSYQPIFQAQETVDLSSPRADQPQGSPPSWGPDRVDISPAAREAAQHAAKSQGVADDADDAVEAFRKYMHKARGGIDPSTSGGTIESLQARLKELQSKLTSVASSPNMPEEAKSSMIAAIQAEINQVAAQIAELEAQAAESG